MYDIMYDMDFCIKYDIPFSQLRLYKHYSKRTGISMQDIDKMQEDVGDIKTNQFLKQRVRDLLIEKMKWS